jgi:hypothetical protein
MKKIILILAITGVLISCSNKEEGVKKETNPELSATVNKEETEKMTETTEKVSVEVEKPALEKKDYEAVSEPSNKETKVAKIKEAPEMETSIDEKVDADVEKEISKVEDETKTVESKEAPAEGGSNKTLYGILGVILAAVAAFFVFKKK